MPANVFTTLIGRNEIGRRQEEMELDFGCRAMGERRATDLWFSSKKCRGNGMFSGLMTGYERAFMWSVMLRGWHLLPAGKERGRKSN